MQLIDTKVGYGRYTGTYELEGKKIVFTFGRFSRPVVRKLDKVNSRKLVLLDENGIEEIYSVIKTWSFGLGSLLES